MKKVKLIEKEYVYYVFIDGLFVRGGEKLNHLFADTGWDMFEEAIHTFESVKRECDFELEVERLPNSSDYIGKENPIKDHNKFHHIINECVVALTETKGEKHDNDIS